MHANIFIYDTDRYAFLDYMPGVVLRYNRLCTLYCLMDEQVPIPHPVPAERFGKMGRKSNEEVPR